MGYVESIRELVGNTPLILVRPSILITNQSGQILLVFHNDLTWGIPGGLMELGETVEECAIREIKEEVGLDIKNLKLFGVMSGKELYSRLENGHEYYNIVIGYICTDFEGELRPDGIEVLDARFFNMNEYPEKTDPLVISKIEEYSGQIKELLKAAR